MEISIYKTRPSCIVSDNKTAKIPPIARVRFSEKNVSREIARCESLVVDALLCNNDHRALFRAGVLKLL